ncbi:DNA integrity scanning protein DisA nucleotide-binding domain protein [Planctomicrobium piriforme]|uniref:DisA checkpoint controller nucleotide-binding n=1 Tax=Planctomicrobium piriforme TaxID=1576369 RepID=A0A1I3NEI2_9PLAN|nr:diadenylate cyclase [Planctomicrobium piriforme]SFJ07768.1 DisA checkpoint controller nucleotide-binding [Planctomicrobium piriforme]
MSRDSLPPILASLIRQARRVAEEVNCIATVMLADVSYDFREIQQLLKQTQLIVASAVPAVVEAAKADLVAVVPLNQEPQTRQVQLSQALLEAIADNLVKTGDRVMALYSGYERDTIDTLSIINLSERLARLTARDLQRLETQVPLGTLRRVVDLAVEIGREGRESKRVGTLFVVGNHRKVLDMSHEQIHDPFKGYAKKERMISNARVRESIKELSQIDGAFVIASDGCVMAAGRILDAPAEDLTLSKGLGARHWAAAAISKATNSIAIAVSESTGTVRLFQNGTVVLRIEPMMQAMKWHDVDTEPPQE